MTTLKDKENKMSPEKNSEGPESQENKKKKKRTDKIKIKRGENPVGESSVMPNAAEGLVKSGCDV